MNDMTQTAQLPAVQRAATALLVEVLSKEFKELAESSKSITAITNPESYQECHAARMRLVKARTATTKRGKEAREDAQAFSKAVIEQEKVLLAIIEPEEKRLQKIQDDFDAIEEEKKRVAAEAEAKRIAHIQGEISHFNNLPGEMAGKDSKAIANQIDLIAKVDVGAWAEEFTPVSLEAKNKCLAALDAMYNGTKVREEAAAAEKAKIEAERAELEKLRAEAAEREKADKARRDQEEAEARAKIEAEQAESRKRIAEEERLAKERRDAEDAERAKIRAKEEAETRERAEAQRAEDERLRLAREAVEAENRRIELERQELMDGKAILTRFLERFGKRPEFKKVVTAIHAYLTGS